MRAARPPNRRGDIAAHDKMARMIRAFFVSAARSNAPRFAMTIGPVHSCEFFRRSGFFCRHDFLDVSARAALMKQVQSTAPARAGVFAGGLTPVVDVTVRNTWQLPLGDGPALAVAARIGALRPELSEHFRVPLVGHEGPTFLKYQPGGFYEPHADRSDNDELEIAPVRRRVSVVIFLNAMRTPPGDAEYAGGALTFYGIVDDPAWRTFGFALQPDPGLLVAFPSRVVHEVTPVMAGERYTIVDWFTA